VSGRGATFISLPSGNRSDIAAANGRTMDTVRIDEIFDGRGDQSPEVEPDVLERLLLSSLATGEADQR
jgi:hypothetical protein